jgi:hypothetical protein
MQTQTKVGKPEVDFSMETATQLEILAVHPEIERVERMGRLVETLTHDRFKEALTMCSVNMLETGKANAFALYMKPDGIEVSDPVLAESEYVCRFGMDPTKCVWHEETKIDELLRDDSPKKQQILYELDEKSGVVVPRKDVWACIMGLPMGGMDGQGLHSTDLQRPTKDMLNFFWAQEQLHPGFIGGVLTHDGNRSGLMLFKKSEEVQTLDTRMWGSIGTEDGVSRDMILPFMKMSGMVYADIDLTCQKSPKNNDPEKLEKLEKQRERKYAQRVARAVETIY